MSYFAVQSLLDTKLSQFTTSYEIAWEAVKYKPTLGQAFLRPTNIIGDGEVLDLANSVQSNVGIYQIDLFLPMTTGTMAEHLTTTDALFQHFKSELKLIHTGGTSVIIRGINRLPIDEVENSWLVSGIEINYISYF